MDKFALERAFAYESLGRWIEKFRDDYSINPQMADTFLARALVIEKDGDAKFASPEEIQAAFILYHIVTIEDSIETGEADDVVDGVTLLKLLTDGLYQHLSILGKLTGKEFLTRNASECISVEIKSDALLGRREQQIEIILAEIAVLGFGPMLIPRGGKAAIEKACREIDLHLFSPDAFKHAWKAGRKQGLFD